MNIKNIITKFRDNIIFSSLIWYTISIMISKGISYFFNFFLAKYYSPDDYGFYSLFITYSQFFSVFIGLNFGAIIPLLKRKYNEDDFSEYVYKYYFAAFPIFFLFLILAIIFQVFKKGKSNVLLSSLINVVIYSFIIHSQYFFLTILQYKKKYKKYSFYLIIWSICQYIILFVLVIIFKKLSISNVIILFNILGLVTIIPLFSNFFKKNWKPSFDILKEGVILSFPLMISTLASTIISYSDRIIIEKYKTISDVGLYSFANNLALVIYFISFVISKMWAPILLEYKIEDLSKAKNQELRIISFFFLFFSLIFTFSNDIIQTIAPKNYSGIENIIKLSLIAYALAFLYSMASNYFYLFNCTSKILIITIISSILSVTLNLIFLKNNPVYFAAIVSIISYGLSFLLTHIYIRYKYKYIIMKKLNMIVFISNFIILFIFVNYIEKNINKTVNQFLSKIFLLIVIFIEIIFLNFNNKRIIKRKI